MMRCLRRSFRRSPKQDKEGRRNSFRNTITQVLEHSWSSTSTNLPNIWCHLVRCPSKTKHPQEQNPRLDHEYRGLYRYFKGGDSSLTGMRREQLFIQLLEGLTKQEADLLVQCCNKSLQENYRITKQVVAEAFPAIEWGNRGWCGTQTTKSRLRRTSTKSLSST